jgi:hypothetical protein
MFALRSHSSQAWLEEQLTTYVVATRREAQASHSTAGDYVRDVPGVWIKSGATLTASRLRPLKLPRLKSSVGSEACSSSSRSLWPAIPSLSAR